MEIKSESHICNGRLFVFICSVAFALKQSWHSYFID